ncbi:helix-turn-helix domain-containing protein [Microbacterium maritypicum]|uniref:helix-turn-helix domain-containing protein n=1 Tax=Microbacterium maritypicum TaxID=33918 RepID=UPI0038270990
MPTTVFEAVRVARGLTQTDLAALCGLSQATVSLLESGQASPSEIALDVAATALRVPAAFLALPAPPRSRYCTR